ncbi:enhanced intracellular survival protein Eis [Natrarchaeobius sp. A-rgal3]|uniref:GNAT family N-acetyltransferase n=1 Tax=Natrarchaeobius versutus TaxID=1679078 RepID=UPI00350F7ADC
MTTYRPLPDRSEVFYEYTSYAFGPEDGVPAYDPEEHDTPRATTGARRGLFEPDADDDRPRAVCKHYWLEAFVRGDRHPMAGLAAVATPPEYRRNGYVGQLLERSLEEYRDRGTSLAALWPFRYRFYRRYGWDTANRIVTHEFDPEILSFARNAGSAGSFVRVSADEFDALEDAYAASPPTLAIDRSERWWRHRVFENHGTDPFVYAYERDGTVAGYLIYRIDGDWGEKTMSISELVAVDREARLALLAFCSDHDSQIERIELRVSERFPLRESAMEPDRIETTVADGPMVRIVDVERALSTLAASGERRSLSVAVDDPLVDWNDGAFRLEASDGETICERIDAAEPEGSEQRIDLNGTIDPDATIDVAALSQLVVGARSATDLERTGRLEVATPDILDALDTLFPETTVYLGDHF